MSTQSLSNVQATLAPGALALLGFVRRQPRHGYDIYRQLSQAPELRAVWRVKQSRLYALLARLEGAGLLSATSEPADGRPPRKVFRLTEADVYKRQADEDVRRVADLSWDSAVVRRRVDSSSSA